MPEPKVKVPSLEERLAYVLSRRGIQKFNKETIERLIKCNNEFFLNPTPDELGFITQIYSISHFQQNLDKKKILQGGYFADPLVIAKVCKIRALL